MKNKRSYILIVLFFVVVIISICFTVIKKRNDNNINTNVKVTINLNDDTTITSDSTSDSIEEVKDNNVYVGAENKVSFFHDSLNTTENTEDSDNSETSNDNVFVDKELDYDNFLDSFTTLLTLDLKGLDFDLLPITKNLYDNIENGIICDDAYNNGFIILKAGLNTDNNTFMCLIRTVNYRTYFKGTLIDGKIDTLTSTILN